MGYRWFALCLTSLWLCCVAGCGDSGNSNPGAKEITGFTILGVDGTINGTNISVTLPYGDDPTSLTPTIAISGVSVSPASGIPQDFSNPVLYTVTAADHTTQTYNVRVGIAPASAKDITQFTILGIDGAISGTGIALTVPHGTDPRHLTPTIAITGASVSPASGVARDFSSPVAYTVTAADATTKVYMVTINVAADSAKDITRFTILGVDGAINGTSISLTVPYGTDPASLTPTIAITGVSINPASGAARDFRQPVTYTVTAANGTTQTYTVAVSVAKNSAKDITQFTILGYDGAISATNISLTLPYGTDRTNLTPMIAITGVSVNPASGIAHDFSAPVTYTVTAADGTTRDYSVSVSVALNDAKDITQFAILGVNGTIAGTDISVTVPYGTDVTNLTPSVAITGASVNPASDTTHDFTSPVIYTVTAADGTMKAYTVRVTVALNSAKDITQFTIEGVDGAITGTSIALTMPYGTDRSSLTPSITITGASVTPASGVPHDFTSAATYTVKAADNSTKSYTVTVTDGVKASSFAAPADYTSGTHPSSVAIADINGDTRADLVVANYVSNTVSVFLNNGTTTPSFLAKVDFAVGGGPSSVALADLNGDGKPDVAVANVLAGTISVLLNTTTAGATTPTFTTKVDLAGGTAPNSVAIWDLNGDTKPDLAVADIAANTVSVLLNTTTLGATTPSFAARVSFATGATSSSVAVGDFNGDGKADLAVANSNAYTVSVLLNTAAIGASTPSFSPKVDFATGNYPVSVAIADLNGDGKPDMAIANEDAWTVSVFLDTTTAGATTPSFTTRFDLATQTNPISVAIGDLNGDATPDLAVADYGSGTVAAAVSIFSNATGIGATSPSFAPRLDFATSATPNCVAIGNLDSDSRQDLAIASSAPNAVTVFANTTQ